jgi:HPt (histidine-containing phosphotransfer) domain-containing protein
MDKNKGILTGYNATIDISMLYTISEDDDMYIRKMVQTFVNNMPSTLQKIDDGVSTADWDAVYKGAHYAKSSLSIIKVHGMTDNMLRIELNAKHKTDIAYIPELLNAVKEQFQNAKLLLSENFALQ